MSDQEQETVEPAEIIEGEDNELEGEPAQPEEPETEQPDDGDEAEARFDGLTPEALEKRTRSAEQRFERYAKGITDLYEEDALKLLPCPLCPDQHKGFVSIDFAGRVPQEVTDSVKLYLGIQREQEYAQDPGTGACPTCESKGKVKTGSSVPGHEARTCPNCKGYGYVPPPTQETPRNGASSPTVTPEAITEALQSVEDVDEWGEPRILPDGRENPNFGKMPNRKVPVEPWGITAGLNALDTAR